MKPYKFSEEYRRKVARILVVAGAALVASGIALIVLVSRAKH